MPNNLLALFLMARGCMPEIFLLHPPLARHSASTHQLPNGTYQLLSMRTFLLVYILAVPRPGRLFILLSRDNFITHEPGFHSHWIASTIHQNAEPCWGCVLRAQEEWW
ncbi:hypothetical protein BJV78DRAFT_1184749 [Lactifluus subvellereus]|nr:hypothetical protein BJV78DRAFT_1184749 [Lactifluus subvellereus]